LKWFITGNSEIKRDMDKSQGVRIVTIHSSKGLEAPVIFLIDTTKIPESENIINITQDDKPIWIWVPRTPNSEIYKKLQSDILNTQIEEYYRLLYVAMTRARDELYIYGYTPYTKANQIAWHTQLWQTLSTDETSDIIRITNDDIK
jgi:ATP-dependent helicase/nuclease subunit A